MPLQAHFLRPIISLLMLCALLQPALADDASNILAQLSQRLVLQESLSGNFHQYKHLPFLDQPLTSSGHFKLKENGDLLWQVTEPAPSLMLVQGRQVTLDGKAVKDRGAGKLIYSIMRGFMSGKLEAIQRHFEVEGDLQSTPWVLHLRPSGRLSGVINSVTLLGDDHLQRIEIAEPETAQTLIEFSGVHPPSDAVPNDDTPG